MGSDPRDVCTLPPAGLKERLAWIRAEILPHAVACERSGERIAWELEDAPGLSAKLEQLVALERECCGGIVFEHGPGKTPQRLRLEVRGVDPQASVFDVPPRA